MIRCACEIPRLAPNIQPYLVCVLIFMNTNTLRAVSIALKDSGVFLTTFTVSKRVVAKLSVVMTCGDGQ